MDSIRDELLFEVDLVQTIGTPGRIVVLGKNAVAIVTGKHEEDVIMAAGQLGEGRICAFTHGGYGKQTCEPSTNFPNSILYRNVRNWVSGKELTDDIKVLKLDESEPKSLMELKKYDFVLSLGAKETTPVSVLEGYIKAGGGMVYATTPWGWMQLNQGKPAYEVPYGKILIDVGIIFTGGMSNDHGSGYAAELNRAEDANIDDFISKTKNDINGMIEKVNLISQITDLPLNIKNKFKNVLQNYWKAINDKVVKTFPSGKIRTHNKKERKILDFWFLCAEMQPVKNFKAYGISDFPGDFEKPPQLTKKLCKFTSERKDFYFTSCYSPAGNKTQINVSRLTNTWTLIIGCHMDNLNGDELKRWPNISSKTEISKPGTCEVSSPFGGSIYLLSPEAASNIEVTINGIVICPRFDSVAKGKPWKESRNDPGLWADISGKYMTVTLPSSSIRSYDDPTSVMKLYDELLEDYNDLRGTNVKIEQKMWIVTDIQPGCGYMHAGYPIVTELDVANPSNDNFLLNAKNFKSSGSWGVFHEMGHNMQQSDWTFQGTGEVTVNIFTLYGIYAICGIDAWSNPWLKKQTSGALSYLKDGADFAKWKRAPGLALYFYAQLEHAFKWDAYKRVFRRYQALTQKPKNDQDKIDLWFLIFSQETKLNLLPMGYFWGFSFSDGGLKKIMDLNLKPFLPTDELTRDSHERVKVVKEQFPKLIRSF